MIWFGFGFNAFGQILASEKLVTGETVEDVKLIIPKRIDVNNRVQESNVTNVSCQQTSSVGNSRIRASWSRRASLHLEKGNGRVCLSGFEPGIPSESRGSHMKEHTGCTDVQISERYLSLSFSDRVECWSLEHNEKTPAFTMEIQTPSEESGPSLALPLVPGGYLAPKPPLYRPLSPQLKAVSLALGAEHAVLLSDTGAVYSWGNGSHGQLGHEGLCAEEEPRALEALLGVPIRRVAAGGWHSACVSPGGDLYMWGWNESGQLGLPSRSLKKEQEASQRPADSSMSTGDETQEVEEVFISIQAFPALVDVTESCDISRVSCGSRHTAAVTTAGDLYTWGWGEYGQLGHGTVTSLDEPRCVEFFQNLGLRVADVACGAWNTFASAVEKEATP